MSQARGRLSGATPFQNLRPHVQNLFKILRVSDLKRNDWSVAQSSLACLEKHRLRVPRMRSTIIGCGACAAHIFEFVSHLSKQLNIKHHASGAHPTRFKQHRRQVENPLGTRETAFMLELVERRNQHHSLGTDTERDTMPERRNDSSLSSPKSSHL